MTQLLVLDPVTVSGLLWTVCGFFFLRAFLAICVPNIQFSNLFYFRAQQSKLLFFSHSIAFDKLIHKKCFGSGFLIEFFFLFRVTETAN
jgi:hypothetical protein